jgi:hypothetical protein
MRNRLDVEQATDADPQQTKKENRYNAESILIDIDGGTVCVDRNKSTYK